MMRIGCKPLKRLLLSCKQGQRNTNFTIDCDEIKLEMNKCIKMLQYIHYSNLNK